MDFFGALFFDEDPTKDYLDDTWGLKAEKWIRDFVKSVWATLSRLGMGEDGNEDGKENWRIGGGGGGGGVSNETGEWKGKKGQAIHYVPQHPNQNSNPIGGGGAANPASGYYNATAAAAAQPQPHNSSHTYTSQYQAQPQDPPLTPTRRADIDEDGNTLVGTSRSLSASPAATAGISKKLKGDEENQNWVE
jgi:hypothetical protein